MKKKKILLCMGTRPEALKMISLVKAIEKHPHFKLIIVLTGQHRELLYQVLRLFKVKANSDLKLMTPNQSLASLSKRILSKMDKVLEEMKPDCVVVQGDTTTAFLTALSAFYKKIPVAHVEAGLRTGNKYEPFPEEINRRLITPLADFHFAPTRIAKSRLLKEGVKASQVLETGNSIIDALLLMKKEVSKRKKPPIFLPKGKKIILITAHRRESFGRPLENICLSLIKIAKQIPNVEIYYPVHFNPNVRKVVQQMLKGFKNIHLLKPVAYDVLVYLLNKADLILTDSGGIQEEAPCFGKPILVLRKVTERPEGVKLGFSKVVGQDPDKIFSEAEKILQDGKLAKKLKQKKNPYGDGQSAKRMVRFFEKKL